jgi:spermidine/putrescine transport system permease protein
MKPRTRITTLLIAPFLLWNLTFVLLPLFSVLLLSFHKMSPDYEVMPSWTLENFRLALQPAMLPTVERSLLYACSTTGLCMLLGYPLAFFIALYGGKHRSRYLILIVLPFWTSYLIRTYAWMTLLQTNGLVNDLLMHVGVIHEPLQLLNTPYTVVLGLTYGFLPFATLPIYVSLEQLDRSLLDAANDLGASPWHTFRTVIFPLSLPGVISGSLITFVPAMGDFVTPELLGDPQTPMIGNAIQQQFLGLFNWPFGSALSLLLMLFMTLSLVAYQKLVTGAVTQR